MNYEWVKARIKELEALIRQGLRRKTLIAVVSGVMALFVGFDVWRAWSSPPPTIESPRFLVTRRGLPLHHPVFFLDYTIRPSELFRHEDVSDGITDQDWHLLAGARLRRSVVTGELLRWRDVQLAKIAPVQKKKNGQRRIEVWSENIEP